MSGMKYAIAESKMTGKIKNARLGRGLVFDDEIEAWQRMQPDAHSTQFWKQERFQDSRQFRGSRGLSHAG